MIKITCVGDLRLETRSRGTEAEILIKLEKKLK